VGEAVTLPKNNFSLGFPLKDTELLSKYNPFPCHISPKQIIKVRDEFLYPKINKNRSF